MEDRTPAPLARPAIPVALEALAWLYLPQLLPFFAGPLMECEHCIRLFLQLFLVLPGALIGLLAADGLLWVWILSAVCSFVVFSIAFNVLGTLRARWPRLILGACIGACSAGNAWVIAAALWG